MEGNLFAKYKMILDKTRKEKEDIIVQIKETTDLNLTEKQIVIKNKTITLYLSSSLRLAFMIRKGGDFLKERGYKVILS